MKKAKLIIHSLGLVASVGLCIAGIITGTVFPTVLAVFTLVSTGFSLYECIKSYF